MNAQHTHADHIIIINGRSFKANEYGMWNLTEIWKALGLSETKRPIKWRNKEAAALIASGQICPRGTGNAQYTDATKFATLQYAGWVSLEFSMMVYAAFESILEMPEVAMVVANKMIELGYQKEAELLERHTNADRDYAHAEMKRWRGVTTNKARCRAVLAGSISLEEAISQGLKGVWLKRCKMDLEAMEDF
ncbi:hypothetical protein [Serratia fonticola]|uniref:KilA-N domain-containing protein n=1 Tax=Serratia fonticola TaxID=47917 RepID=A0ABY9PMC2_SERFO|nr:hypothetical protein [Serratia fonticola]WMT13888.1 hypothetical protein RFB13_22195 [Serratia fonticola]